MFIPDSGIVHRILPDSTEVSALKVGGQKAVYKATCRQHGRVVIKVMLPTGQADRLMREIKIVSENNFPNVPKILESGQIEVGGQQVLYIVEPYIDGSDLRAVLNNKGHLSLPDAISLMNSLLDTVIALEENGVVHRDIKPENILCSTEGKYWLLDFGIARDLRSPSLTATAAHFGPHTAGYAAPEQFRNMKKKIDSKADLFSVGVVLYEALTGKHPFSEGARDYLDVLRRTETFTPEHFRTSGDTNDEISKFVQILIEKYPSRRPPSAKMAGSWFQQIIRDINGGK
jgi:eukaryotic-like serine/threonine-protein kinase